MSDRHLLFAEDIPIPNLLAQRWLQRQLEIIAISASSGTEKIITVSGDLCYALDQILDESDLHYLGYRFLRDVVDGHPDNLIEDATDIGFEIEFTFPTCMIYCRDNGDLDKVGVFMQQYLRQFNGKIDPVWSMTFAMTCSRPEIGEFDGGYMVVTADRVVIELANQAMKRRLEKLDGSVWE